MTEMWDGATEPLQAHAEQRRFHLALAEAERHWAYLASATSEADFGQRLAMVGSDWEAGVRERFERRFATQHAARQMEVALSKESETGDESPKGDYANGVAAGKRDRENGDDPGVMQASDQMTDYVRGYWEGYGGKPKTSSKAVSEMTDEEIAAELADDDHEWDTPGDDRKESLVEEQAKRRKTSAHAPDSGQQCPSCRQYEAHWTDIPGEKDEDGEPKRTLVCDNCDYGVDKVEKHSAKTAATFETVADAVGHIHERSEGKRGANISDVAYLLAVDHATARRRIEHAVQNGQIERRADGGKNLFPKQGGYFEQAKEKVKDVTHNMLTAPAPMPYGHEHATDGLSKAIDENVPENRRSPKTATLYCTTHDVYVGDGNRDTHTRDSCNVEQRKAKESAKQTYDEYVAWCKTVGFEPMSKDRWSDARSMLDKADGSKQAADKNAWEQGYHDGFMDGTRGGRGGFALQNSGRGSEADYAEGYYSGFDAAVYSEDNMLPVIGSDGYRTCPTCKGSGAHPWDAVKKCTRCKGVGVLRPPKGKREPDLDSIFSTLHEATEDDLLEAEALLAQADGDLNAAASFFGDLPHPHPKHINPLTEEERNKVDDRTRLLTERHHEEHDEEAASRKRHDDYFAAHPSASKGYERLGAHHYAGRDLLARDPEDHLHTDLTDDLLAGQGRDPEEPEPEEEIRYRGPTPLDYFMHGLFPSGAAASKTAAGENIFGDADRPELAPEVHTPVTTRPRVTPELKRDTEFTIPGTQDGLNPNVDYTDPSRTMPVNYANPTFEQAVAAKVAKIAKRVAEDNPHLSQDETRTIAMQALSTYPEMVQR